jgi:hypothetical protein
MSEYEITWGMVYEADSPEEALYQALGDLSGVIIFPSEGPNVFVARRTDTPLTEQASHIVLHADQATSPYKEDSL